MKGINLKIIKESHQTDQKDRIFFKTIEFNQSIKVIKKKNIIVLKELLLHNETTKMFRENEKLFLKLSRKNHLTIPVTTTFSIQKNPIDNLNLILLFKDKAHIILKETGIEKTLEIVNKKEEKQILKAAEKKEKLTKKNQQKSISKENKTKRTAEEENIIEELNLKQSINEDFIEKNQVNPFKELIANFYKKASTEKATNLV
tara:strand:+ start:31 stop:636 length:606 start_codon:yes stop_codon:yes gene_type:complete